jgi:hypothetical protein
MSLSDRDRKIVMVIVPLVVVLGYWFLLLAPKREAAATAETALATEQARLSEAQALATTVEAAKANFARDYSAVVALGKAIPTSVDMPSLLVQLEQAARGTGIEFDGVTVGERETAEAAPAAPGTGAPDPAAPTAPSGQAPQSAPGAAVADAQATADAAAPPTGDGTTPAAGGAAAPAPASALETVSLEFSFKGSFFELADFFHRMKRFVYVSGDKVRVRGRLLTIDSVKYETSADTFPALGATVQATVFLSPKAEGATAGATPAGPGAPAAPLPTATASSSSPTPAATATP